MCRHRGAPLASGCGHARALSCPYHAWLYRLDGSLARAGGVGQPEGFDAADFGLREIQVATFARSIMVNADPSAAPFDPGPLGSGLDPYRLDDLEVGERTRYECRFNWKVLLENYCENYHTPFIHSQLPVGGYEYPIECAGNVVFAWDRPLDPRDRSEAALHDHRPGEPGWAAVADVAADESFNNGSYLALFPNTAVSCFAGFAATFRLTPTGPSTTVVERDYLWHPSVAPERRAADLAATREVVEQDLAICTALQGPTTPGSRPTGCSRPSTSPVSPTSTSSCSPPSPPGTEPPSVRSPAMPSSTRTRISVEQRRQQILDATHRVTLQRGLHDVRIADVAAELDVSTGLIHYHFDTRDELLEAMLRETAAAEVAALRRALATLATPEARLVPADRRVPAVPSARSVLGAVDRRLG